MLTFCIIVCVVAAIILVPIGRSEEKKPGFPIITTFIAAIIVVVVMVIPTTALVVAVGDTAEFITSVDEFNDVHQNLYYDNTESKYFIVEADLWDITKLQHRKYLNAEMVEQYLEHKNAIENIPLFEKGDD